MALMDFSSITAFMPAYVKNAMKKIRKKKDKSDMRSLMKFMINSFIKLSPATIVFEIPLTTPRRKKSKSIIKAPIIESLRNLKKAKEILNEADNYKWNNYNGDKRYTFMKNLHYR